MPRFTALVRFLMVLACVLPLPGSRQAMSACAPPGMPVPGSEREAPVSEEDDERSASDAQRHSAQHTGRRPSRATANLLPPAHVSHPSHRTTRTSPPEPHDPFHNGLGSHYRC